ncbi:D-amino-acid N-acetyltransferase [Didymosphaeria variabile]|uniref:D-amino-acid N-acetyltransferase n=1 Tax=Didymosphaeria variabile TaxID=1932322 RepID=A0A9W9CFV9_9PLEO|nr:D-amino-acid N-acetyltransferase [Didymosphaeria variabile]KAJ4360064.1 D-amino-acid N-acetyltransferase [Didymosphaeria variabile]
MSVSTISKADWTQWQNLFRQYIAFYQTSIPETQYQNTFDRIIDPSGDLHALAIREEDGSLNGIAHYLFHTSSWSDKPVCYLNDLFVNPDIRGKGYGRKLIVACGKAAEERGCSKYYWLTRHENAVARKLYDTFGDSGYAEYRVKLPSDKW